MQGGTQQGAKRLGQTTDNDKAIRRFQKYVEQQAKILKAQLASMGGEETTQAQRDPARNGLADALF